MSGRSRLCGRRQAGSPECRRVAAPWRFSTRHVRCEAGLPGVGSGVEVALPRAVVGWLAQEVRIGGARHSICGISTGRWICWSRMGTCWKQACTIPDGRSGRPGRGADLLRYDLRPPGDRQRGGGGGGGGPRRRGNSKNSRGDAPHRWLWVLRSRVTAFRFATGCFPATHGNAVGVSTVAGVKRALRGWKPNRCVFAGTAGMVLEGEPAGGGCGAWHHIVCMPVHPGGKIGTAVRSHCGRYREAGPNQRV